MKKGMSPLREIVVNINKNLIEDISKGKKIKLLEIGCGSWSYIKDNLPSNVEWFGIEPLMYKDGKRSIATKKGSVESIPYKSNSFDIVLANQSMEHWYEYGVTFKKAISEISRVLKKSGYISINSPLRLHGHKYFTDCKLSSIKNLFVHRYWKRKKFMTLFPTQKYCGWKENKLISKKFNNDKSSGIIYFEFSKTNFYKTNTFDIILYWINKIKSKIIPYKVRIIMHQGILNVINQLIKK
jgi:SAM-dependent methyltransferase